MKKRGLSLVELLVTLAVGSILVNLAYSITKYGNKLYDSGSSEVMLQDIQRVIIMEMSDDIRTSEIACCTLPLKFSYLSLPPNDTIYKPLIYIQPYLKEDFVYVLNKNNNSLYRIYKNSTILVIPGNIINMDVIESTSHDMFNISGIIKCSNKTSYFNTAATITKK